MKHDLAHAAALGTSSVTTSALVADEGAAVCRGFRGGCIDVAGGACVSRGSIAAIEELDQRRDALEHLEQLRIEPRTGGERGLVLTRSEKLLELQVVRGWMILADIQAGTRVSRSPMSSPTARLKADAVTTLCRPRGCEAAICARIS